MSENTNKHSDTNSLRFNENKLRWDYVHFKSLEPMVRVLEYGAKKYAPMNWMKDPKDSKEHLTSMMRHLTALMDGEFNDPESGLPHIGHIMCNALFHSYHNYTDKRYTPIEFHKDPNISLNGNMSFYAEPGTRLHISSSTITSSVDDLHESGETVKYGDEVWWFAYEKECPVMTTAYLDVNVGECYGPSIYDRELETVSNIRIFKDEKSCKDALIKFLQSKLYHES
jgi:hypothetical protein